MLAIATSIHLTTIVVKHSLQWLCSGFVTLHDLVASDHTGA